MKDITEYYDLISLLDKEEKKDLYLKLMKYVFNGIEPTGLNSNQTKIFNYIRKLYDE